MRIDFYLVLDKRELDIRFLPWPNWPREDPTPGWHMTFTGRSINAEVVGDEQIVNGTVVGVESTHVDYAKVWVDLGTFGRLIKAQKARIFGWKSLAPPNGSS